MSTINRYVNHVVEINNYIKLENLSESTVQLYGKINFIKWMASITTIHRHDFTQEEVLNMIKSSDECCSYHLIGETFYKIFVIFEDETINVDPNSLIWDNSTSYSDLNIPNIIFCYLIGQITTIL